MAERREGPSAKQGIVGTVLCGVPVIDVVVVDHIHRVDVPVEVRVEEGTAHGDGGKAARGAYVEGDDLPAVGLSLTNERVEEFAVFPAIAAAQDEARLFVPVGLRFLVNLQRKGCHPRARGDEHVSKAFLIGRPSL